MYLMDIRSTVSAPGHQSEYLNRASRKGLLAAFWETGWLVEGGREGESSLSPSGST